MADAILAEQRLTSELAHELRTPLTAVLATADLVALRGDLDEELRTDIADIQSACRAMAATVTGLLDLARDRSGPVRAGSGLREVVTSVCAEVDPDGRVEARVGAGVDLALSHDLAVRALAPVVRNAVELAHHVLVRTERDDGDLVRVVRRGRRPRGGARGRRHRLRARSLRGRQQRSRPRPGPPGRPQRRRRRRPRPGGRRHRGGTSGPAGPHGARFVVHLPAARPHA